MLGRVGSAFVYILVLTFKSSSTSRIEYYGGEYRNILVAISPEIDVSRCAGLIAEIQTSLSGTSSKLYAATDGKVHFADIKILIPREWTPSACGLSQPLVATAADSYSSADIKITESHPLAKSLPWTSQFKGCGQSGDDIFIPPDFLVSPNFSSDQKAQLLLHEWTKFRYGVFEEYGYFGDEVYPACYIREGSLHFTSCSNTALLPLTNVTSADCATEVNANSQELKSQLGSGTSSLMSMPHLERISRFCSESNHNGFVATKQNAICSRRSVGDVVNSHSDFTSAYGINSKQLVDRPPTFQIIRHVISGYKPGYAFVIEDSAFIREESRLRYVKQAVTQMIDMMGIDAMAAISTFSGGVVKTPLFYGATEADKQTFINLLPDLNTAPFTSKLSPLSSKQSVGNNNLYFAFTKILTELNELKSHKWNIVLITSNPSTSFKEARDLLHATPHSLSVLSFDNSDNWLQMYTTPNTKDVMVLPNCFLNGNVCSTKASSLAVDEFVELMRSQDSPRFLEKVAQAELERGGQTWFTVEFTASRVTRFFVYFSLFTDTTSQVRFSSPTGTICTASRIYNYEYVLRMDTTNQDCGYQTGNWSVDLSSTSLPENVKYSIQVFAESEDEPNRLVVSTTLGASTKSILLPNSQLTPVYARVMDLLYRPVIDAQVGLNIHTSLSTSDSFQEVLRDDGMDPDITKNDGVYSAYLQGYSSTPAFHTGQLTVTSVSSQTRSIVSLRNTNEYSAALLDPNLSSKCCGSSVPVGDTSPVASARYSALLSGFKTGEDFNPITLPPSKIGNIKITQDDGISRILEYIAPGATINTGRVDHYDTCCTYNESSNTGESSCRAIENNSECIPVDAGGIQTCRLDRDSLINSYLENVTSSHQNQTVFLYCGIRGVNALMVSGAISNTLVEIDIFIEPSNGGSGDNRSLLKCDSISDDCLPIAVFWGLIGCIIGLVLVLLVVIICWCCTSRKNTNKGKNREEVLMKMNREPKMPDKDSPLYNVYVNKAYIQETDGQMKLVAAEGELLPFEGNQNQNGGVMPSNRHISGPVPSVRRRSVSAEMDRDNHRMGNPNSGMDDTRLYKSYFGNNKPDPPPKPMKSTFLASRSEDNLAPIARNRYPKTDTDYANSNNNTSSGVPISTISSSRQNMEDDVVPIYASVNRNGRKMYPNGSSTMPTQPIASILNQNSTFQRPKSRNEDHSPSRLTLGGGAGDMPVQNRFSRPLSSQSQPQSLPATRPSLVRLDAFPSSESDSYSDMSRGVPVLPTPPPVPPPFPKNAANLNGQSFVRNSPDRHNLQPNSNKATTRTPARESGIPSPLGPPPPPPPQPPRRQSVTQVPNGNKHKQSDSEYESDDSTHWDDEDMEFAPVGDSYA